MPFLDFLNAREELMPFLDFLNAREELDRVPSRPV